jgi:hypothetical protein
MIDLDALIERARSATVDRAAAERYVSELERRERAVPRPRRWVPWLAGGLAAAAAAAAALRLWPDPPHPPGAPVAISDRVTVIADPDTVYHPAHTGADDTTITVERGAVTARLWPGERRHRLVLAGGGITAVATGTVYSLAVRSGAPMVSVVQGTVEVDARGAVHTVHAGQSWPPDGQGTDPAAGRALLALSAPPPATDAVVVVPIDAGVAPSPDAGEPVDAPAPDAAPEAVDAGAATQPHRAPALPVPTPAPTVKDRWRTARQLRGQGQLDRAIAECLAIADARDATWSPIALVEAVRIELGPLADRERAIDLAERMLREWPSDALAPEARELRCRALRQLGRGGECAAAPQR